MSLSKNIKRIRKEYNMSQEDFAFKLNVTRQAVQKWEAGIAMPDVYNLKEIAKIFNVSLDTLVFDENIRFANELGNEKTFHPDYKKQDVWEQYAQQLGIEYQQSIDEGLDIKEYKALFDSVGQLLPGKIKSELADILFRIVSNAAQVTEYKFYEPSELLLIQEERKSYSFQGKKTDRKIMEEKIYGAWLGRICGCLLGKPIEGIKTEELIPLLKQSGNYPMHRYILTTDVTEEMYRSYNFNFRLNRQSLADVIEHAPADDDTNYVVLAQVLIENYGHDFTRENVACVWMDYQPKKAYCTAERVAYRNFVAGYNPPESAVYKNPYREWIGAQIRGDYYGYINPGNPELAAEMAWRDASISHTKNGIYGEMFVAAMLACAAVTDNIEDIIRGGLAQIPYRSRLYQRVSKIIEDFQAGVSQEECFSNIHALYDEHNEHGWTHTIPNAMIVVSALLYGGGDYGRSICMAVETGFDTDCNGATVGSVLGMRNGVEGIEDAWKRPVNDMLDTHIFGYGTVKISDCVDLTLKHMKMDGLQ